jgi:hypothetical protein
MKSKIIAVMILIFWAVPCLYAQNISGSIEDLINHNPYVDDAQLLVNETNQKYGTQTDLDRLKSYGDMTGDTIKKAYNHIKQGSELYSMIDDMDNPEKRCQINREIKIFNERQIKEIFGNFGIKGIKYYTDMRICEKIRNVSVTWKSVPVLNTTSWTTTVLTWDYYRTRDLNNMCKGTINIISLKKKMFAYPPKSYVTFSCTVTSTTFVDEPTVTETITNNCLNLEENPRCTLLSSDSDPKTKTINGYVVTRPWWNKKDHYSCQTNNECSAFPENENQCSSFLNSNIMSCPTEAGEALRILALNRYRDIANYNLTCEQLLLNNITGSLKTGSNYPYGCGIYNHNEPSLYSLINQNWQKVNAKCILPEIQLPENILTLKESTETEGGDVSLSYVSYDYYTEKEIDHCQEMTAGYLENGIKCTFKDEWTDGIQTYISGNPTKATTQDSSTILAGTFDSYTFERSWWNKKQVYTCQIITADINLGAILEITPTGVPGEGTQNPDNDLNSIGEALSGLKVIDDISQSLQDNMECTSGGDIEGCLDIALFKGKAIECRTWWVGNYNNLNCCNGGYNTDCEESEKVISSYFETDITKKVGNYCSNDPCVLSVGGECVYSPCIEKKDTFCAFQTVLAKELQHQGRIQLGLGWGDNDSPNCRGLTMEEFLRIDLSKIDFSRWIESLDLGSHSGYADPDADEIQDKMVEKFNQLLGQYQ